jgi:1-acyl-sn-glycerol-3-phosphate acyltransferase
MGDLFSRAVKLFLRPALAATFSLRSYGRENVPERGGAILASNHASFLDPVLVGAAVDRPLDYFARSTLFCSPLGPLLRALNGFPVERAKERAERAERGGSGAREAGVAAIRGAIERLRAGRLLLVFPEGTRSMTGELGPFEPGIALFARRAAVPILPVAIDGSFEAWSRARPIPRLGVPCAVAIGKPIAGGNGALLERVRDEILRLRSFLVRRRDPAGPLRRARS